MQEAIVPGTLLPDGTLQLHRPVPLPPGNVEVVVRAQEKTGQGLLESLERIWAEARRLGLKPRAAEEIDAEINALRDATQTEIGELDRYRSGETPDSAN